MRFTILLLLLPFSVLASKVQEMYIAAKSGLSLRSGQSASCTLIAKINYGEKVTVLSYDSSLVVEGFQTVWARVKYKEKEGYVASIYLFKYPPPKQGTDSVKNYFKQLSALVGPPVENGGNGVDDEEEGLCWIRKSFYKNGFEHHEMIGYEYGSSMYILPNIDLQHVFQLFRALPEFKRFINASSPFPFSSKTINSTHKITVLQTLDEKGVPNPYAIESIKFYSEDFDIAELEFFEKEGQVFVIFGSGV